MLYNSIEMIILVEPDKDVRKNLADLMSRERIIGVDSISQSLQMILKFKNDLDLIVANVNPLSEMLSKHIIERVCQKLDIGIPPILAIYKENEKDARNAFIAEHKGYETIKYVENDLTFPNHYLELIQKSCPELVIDYEKARDAWLKKQQPQELVDPRQWLEEEGFLEPSQTTASEGIEKGADDIIASIQTFLDEETAESEEQEEQRKPAAEPPVEQEAREDYEKLYQELKQKYDELLKNVRAFMESVTKNDG